MGNIMAINPALERRSADSGEMRTTLSKIEQVPLNTMVSNEDLFEVSIR